MMKMTHKNKQMFLHCAEKLAPIYLSFETPIPFCSFKQVPGFDEMTYFNSKFINFLMEFKCCTNQFWDCNLNFLA
jgi:hypothetical protein